MRVVAAFSLSLLYPICCKAWLSPYRTTVPSARQRIVATTTSTSTGLLSVATPSSESSSSSSSSEQQQQSLPPHSSSHQQQPQATGRVLEGGKVIDFSSVKASSKAEHALAAARNQLLQSQQQQSITHGEHIAAPVETAILGINKEVIDEVGHELGTFATAQEIQDCAAYLKALYKDSSAAASTLYSRTQIARFEQILKQAYEESGEVTGAFAKTFYMGTMLLPEAARQAIWAIYVWCRRTDEIVDAPRENEDDMLRDLSSWEWRLEQLWSDGQVVDVYDLVLLHVHYQYPEMEIVPFMDMIRGMLMDVPGLGQDRYENFDELHLYCYRVAGTVGLMSLPIFGCAPGFDYDKAREPALSLGVAFQLTNILRDVGEDAVKRGRVYLPQEDLKKFGVTEDQIFEQRVDENFIALMKFEIERARMYYERARRGVFMLAPESRLPVQSSLDAYGRILDKIEENGYDSLTKRAYVDKWEKLSIIPFSWYRTTEVSRVLPLPGDKPVILDEV